MMKNKRTDAAMEFLIAYGWAILVVLIVIGALFYFGVLSPERFRFEPDKCDCSYVNMSYFFNRVVENNIAYIECFTEERYLNEDKTRIESQITYTIFYCNEDLNQLIEVK